MALLLEITWKKNVLVGRPITEQIYEKFLCATIRAIIASDVWANFDDGISTSLTRFSARFSTRRFLPTCNIAIQLTISLSLRGWNRFVLRLACGSHTKGTFLFCIYTPACHVPIIYLYIWFASISRQGSTFARLLLPRAFAFFRHLDALLLCWLIILLRNRGR